MEHLELKGRTPAVRHWRRKSKFKDNKIENIKSETGAVGDFRGPNVCTWSPWKQKEGSGAENRLKKQQLIVCWTWTFTGPRNSRNHRHTRPREIDARTHLNNGLKPVSAEVLRASQGKKTHKCEGTKIKYDSDFFAGSNANEKMEHSILERRKTVQLEL